MDLTTIDMCKSTNKLSHRRWKAMLKKQKRKIKRQELAKNLECAEGAIDENDEPEVEQKDPEDGEKNEKEHLKWLERENEAQELFRVKKEKEERERIQKENEERQIREEFEREKQQRQSKENKEVPKGVLEKKVIPEVWHNPEPPKGYNPDQDDQKACPFFKKVGACRFGINCSRLHATPYESSSIMFPGMFACFELEQAFHDALDSDINLEFEDSDKYDEFLNFYEDVYPEFLKAGRINKFLVCCNYEPHLRGNVYIEYSSIEEAVQAFRMLNGRWFDKKQLSCQFVKIDSWTSAICGLFHKNRCPKGKHCNFLHVFQNPVNSNRLPNHHSKHQIRSRGRSRSRERTSDKHHKHGSSRRTSYRTRSPSSRSRKNKKRSKSKDRKRKKRSSSPDKGRNRRRESSNRDYSTKRKKKKSKEK